MASIQGQLVVACLLVLGLIGFASAQDEIKKPEFKAPELKPPTEKLPDFFAKKTPGSIDDLKAIQEHVAKVVDKVMPAWFPSASARRSAAA